MQLIGMLSFGNRPASSHRAVDGSKDSAILAIMEAVRVVVPHPPHHWADHLSSTVQYNALQCSTMQYSGRCSEQYSGQYSEQYSTAPVPQNISNTIDGNDQTCGLAYMRSSTALLVAQCLRKFLSVLWTVSQQHRQGW
jgi:hypothetical protein